MAGQPVSVRELLSVSGHTCAAPLRPGRRGLLTDPSPLDCLQLPNLGVNQASITFNNVTCESDKFCCVRETGDANQLVRRGAASWQGSGGSG